jgi:hypothetical protein
MASKPIAPAPKSRQDFVKFQLKAGGPKMVAVARGARLRRQFEFGQTYEATRGEWRVYLEPLKFFELAKPPAAAPADSPLS